MANDEGLPDRFDVERAVEASDLPTCSRDILFALARRMDQGTTYIPGQFSPSLYKMSEVSGWSKRHIQRHLNQLEKRQLLSRLRKKGVRTRYAINYPKLLETRRPEKAAETGDTESPPLGTTGPAPGDNASRELGTRGRRTRDTTARSQISQSLPDQDPDPEITMIRRLIEARTGKQVSAEWAAATRDTILAAAGAPADRGPARSTYIRAVIVRERQPARWLPTPTPPQYRQGEEIA